MARLSIVIPCLGEPTEFDGTLVSVLQNRPADCEVIVAHRQPYDDPYALADEVNFLHYEANSLVELLNEALTEVTGEVLHVLGCGLEATESWTAAPLTHFADPDVGSVSPLVLDRNENLVAAGVYWSLGGARRLASNRRLVEAGSGRLRAKILGPTLTASFFRRETLIALGGFEASMTDQLADVAASLDLRRLGRLHVVEPTSRLIQSARPTAQQPSGFQRGRAAERIYWRSATDHSLALTLPFHAAHVASDSASGLSGLHLVPALLGRTVACAEIGAVRRYEERIEKARQELTDLATLRSSRNRKIAIPQSGSQVLFKAA